MYYYIWTVVTCSNCEEVIIQLTKVNHDKAPKMINELVNEGCNILAMICLPSADDNEFKRIIL